MMEDVLFLLGGHDLEMDEIRKMLDASGVRYLDSGPDWNAKFADYVRDGYWRNMIGARRIYGVKLPGNSRDLISSLDDERWLLEGEMDDVHDSMDQDIYGGTERDWVEERSLRKDLEDIDMLINSIGDDVSYSLIVSSARKSSIEQVAKILGVELTRDKQLIAAFVRGGETAMKKMDATLSEIEDIHAAFESYYDDDNEQLVAVNDSGDIPAMKAIGTTNEEIAEIRRQEIASGAEDVTQSNTEETSEKIHLSRFGEKIDLSRFDTVFISDVNEKLKEADSSLERTLVFNREEESFELHYDDAKHTVRKVDFDFEKNTMNIYSTKNENKVVGVFDLNTKKMVDLRKTDVEQRNERLGLFRKQF